MDDAESARDAGPEAVPLLPLHTRIQHYELLTEIGRGGMGIVYRARDTTLARMVALKRPWPKAITNAAERRRFLREARAAARISHPHVVPVFEVFEDEGIPWIAMELVTGSNLRGLIQASGALPVDEVLRHAEGLADALAAAHSNNILHGDVTPNNILVDSRGRVLLTDFGLAQFVAGPVDEDASTVSGSIELSGRGARVAGTPGYMSPEQARGHALDGRSDLFSLGAVLYEMCTGRRAFVGESRDDLIDAAFAATPPDIPASAGLPDGLVRSIHKALARDPDERYQTARDLLADLRVLRREVEFEHQAALHPIRRRNGLRRPSAFAAILAALAAAATLAGYQVYHRPGAGSQHTEPVSLLIADFENTTGDAIFDETVVESLSVALSQSRHVNVFPRERAVEVLRRMKRAPESRIGPPVGREICQREGLNILLDGSIRRSGTVFQIRARAIDPFSGDLLFAESDQFEARNELFGRVDALARRVRKNLGESSTRIEQTGQPLEKATTDSVEALQLYSKARRLEALGDRPGAVKLLNAALQIDSGFAMAHLHLGGILGNQGEITSAKAHLERAYALRADLTILERLHVEADYYEIQGEYDKTLASLESLVDRYPSDLSGRRKLASAYENAGDPEAATRELRAAMQIDPLDAGIYSALARVLVSMNSPSEALSLLDAAKTKALSAPDFHWSAGLAWLSLDQVDHARTEFQDLEKAGAFYVDLGQLNLARLAMYEGKLAEAEERLTIGVRRDEREGNEVYRVLRRNLRARLRWLSGNERGAREDLKSIAALDDPTFAAYQLAWAARLWVEIGDLSEARSVVASLRRLASAKPSAFKRACLRVAEGEVALAEGDPGRATEAFMAAAGERPIYEAQWGLAKAYGAQHQWKQAADAWSNVLAARGEILRRGNPPDLAIAHLELARTWKHVGDTSKAAENYDALSRLWQDADDFLLRRQALSEGRGLSIGQTR